jgi:hypothetical protein
VRDSLSGTGMGKIPSPLAVVGMGTGEFCASGEQNVKPIPGGDSPVACTSICV